MIDVNTLIERTPLVRDEVRQHGAIVPMNDRQIWPIVGSEFMGYFSRNLNGETNAYIWHTVIVDGLRNLKINRK